MTPAWLVGDGLGFFQSCLPLLLDGHIGQARGVAELVQMRLGRAPQTSTARLPLVTDNAETALMAGSRQNPFAFAWTAQGKGVVAAYHKPVFFS